jgi:hypothetical protein
VKRTPANVLLIAAGNAVAVIVALGILAWFTIGRDHSKLRDALVGTTPGIDSSGIQVIPFETHDPKPQVPPRVAVSVPKPDPEPPKPNEAAIVSKLREFEQAGDYAAALRATLRESASLSERERDELLMWLSERQASTAFPTLFMISRTHQDAGRTEDAAKWYMAASLCGLIDASRFADPTANDAVKELERQFGDIRQRLRQDGGLRVEAVRFALELEESISDRQPAMWIAAHAKETVAGESAAVLDDAAWQAKRIEYRTMFTNFLDRAAKLSVVELDWDF